MGVQLRNPHAPPPLHHGVNLPHFLPGCHDQGRRKITLSEATNPCGVCTGRKEGAPKAFRGFKGPNSDDGDEYTEWRKG